MSDCDVMLPNVLDSIEDCQRLYDEQLMANHNCNQHGLKWACELKENIVRKNQACIRDQSEQLRAFEKCVSGG